MDISKLLYLLVISIFLLSCGPTAEDQAREKVNFARTLLQQNDTVSALLQLDSVARKYPKAVYAINAAKNLRIEILWEIMRQKMTLQDSVKVKIEKLKPAFVLEKGEFERFAQYTHRRQNYDRAWNRTYLKIFVDEKGNATLTSNYHGAHWINHTALRVYDTDIQAKTDSIPAENVDNYHSNFLEGKWEKVTYRNDRDNGVIAFIANNADRKLKATLLGKPQSYIVLEDADKQAIREAYIFAEALKSQIRLDTEIKNLQALLNKK